MSNWDLVIVDDAVARDWQPFTLTRPAAELIFGTTTLRERIEGAAGRKARAILGHPDLAGFEEEGTPPVVAEVAAVDRPTLFVLSRFVPKGPLPKSESACTFIAGSTPVAWYVPAGAVPDFTRPAETTRPVEGRVLDHVWELMSKNGEQATVDIETQILDHGPASLPPGAFAIGEPKLFLGRNVRVEPGVVFDFTSGPVWIDDDVTVRAFARIAGPSWFGRGTIVYGGTYTGVCAGPECRLRGEIESTVILGYSNKAHDGFIGHGYIGRWVNLGAMTTNSDLKNNYGPVRLWTPRDPAADTGEMKIGGFLGDHVKTGIGALINTGTVVGAGSNLFGGGMPPKYVPPFSWGSGADLGEYELEKFLTTARTVMRRRNVDLTEGMRLVLERAWHASRSGKRT